MRLRLATTMLITAALFIGASCTSDREPLAPLPPPSFSGSHHSGPPSLDDQIELLIRQLFPLPRWRIAAFIRFEAIEFLKKRGKIVQARQRTLELVEFALERYRNHQLIGDQSPATQARLQSFVDLLFQFVGLGSAPIPPGALGLDGAVAIVGPTGGLVVTGTEFAGVTFPPNALPQTVVVTLSRNPNQESPLPTTLAQFPLFYDFKTFPEVPVFGQPVTVGVCVLDDFIPEGGAESLRLAHPLHSDPSTIEILPLAAAPFLDCAGAGLFGARNSPMTNLANAGRSVARDLFWLAMGAPSDLQASMRRRSMMPGGLGGRTGSFSTFGAVDFTGVLVPYGAAGYRYRVTNSEDTGGGFEQPEFNDASFFTGAAAFGSGSVPEGQVCALDDTVETPWALNTDLLLRKTFELPSGVGNVQVSVAIDNDVQVFVNGTDITSSGGDPVGGFLIHDGCAARGSFNLTVPESLLHPGANLVAVRARDRGVISYVDIQVTGSLSEE